jgi:hypothetical protein
MYTFQAPRVVSAGSLALLSILLGPFLCRADTIYTYTGNHFTNAPLPYTTSDSITGFFTLSSPLGDNLALANIAADVLSFSFTDGSVNTITSSANSGSFFLISTNSQGNITAWDVRAFLGPVPTNVALFTCDGSTAFNGCPNFPRDESYLQNGAVSAFNTSNPGTWTSTQTTPTPEPSSLVLLSFSLGMLSMLRLRKRSRENLITPGGPKFGRR